VQAFANIGEIYLYDMSDIEISTRDGCVYTASSSYNSANDASKAFDKLSSTQWHSALTGTTQWICIEFPEAVSLKSFGITAAQDCINSFSFEASNDGQTWDTLLTQTDIYSGWTMTVERKFDLPIIIEYSSAEDIVSGVDNAKQTRTNSKLDDGSDSVTGVDFFTYNGDAVSNVYLNGNSYVGFGSDAADLKVNNRDNAMYNNWREEGSLNGVRFLRVRWGGYANYNVQYDEYKLIYDVLMFETGDICLYMADIPTSNNTGDYKLGDQTFTAPTTDNRWVTFYKTNTGFEVKYEPISFVQSLTKYLIRNEGTLYTVADGALSEVTGDLTAELFQSSGVDEVPDGTLLMALSAPEVLCWTNKDAVPVLTATVQGVPTGEHGIVSDEIPVGHSSIYGIKSVVATASDGATFLLSFDGGAWMAYTDGTWSASDDGMTAAELMAISSTAWSSVINSAQYMQLKAIISGVETVTQVVFNFNNESPTSQSEESEV